MSATITAQGSERAATEKELAAAMLVFEAEVFRNDPARLNLATERAHAALQNHLDAFASLYALVIRDIGQGK